MTRRVWSPRPMSGAARDLTTTDDRETAALVALLREHGELTTDELRRRAQARLWGPGRFRPALRRAVASGAVRRVGRRTWAASDRR
jgi:hypothetical protein